MLSICCHVYHKAPEFAVILTSQWLIQASLSSLKFTVPSSISNTQCQCTSGGFLLFLKQPITTSCWFTLSCYSQLPYRRRSKFHHTQILCLWENNQIPEILVETHTRCFIVSWMWSVGRFAVHFPSVALVVYEAKEWPTLWDGNHCVGSGLGLF
jgi:hypothetical protein